MANKMFGYLTVIGGISVHLFAGNLYLWGNIHNYVLSYYHYKGQRNLTMKSGAIVLPLSICFENFSILLCTYLF